MKNSLKIIVYAGALTVSLVGCKKGFHDINDNPNNITASSIRTNLVLPAALHSAGATDAGGSGIGYNWLNRWMGYWSSSGSFSPTQEESTYNLTGNFMEGKWERMYNYLNDFYFVEQKAASEGKDFYAGIAKVMKAKYFQDLVDLFGNVPYSQAFQLAQFPTPKYDKGEVIYADLQLQLDAAIEIFKNKPVPGEAGGTTAVDIVFHGDKTLWIKFANTLKLRLLIRQTQVPGFSPWDELAKIQSNGDVLQSGESASVNPGYTNATGKQNPFYANFGFTVTGNNANEAERANAYLIGILKTNNDPRLQRYFRPASSPLNPADPYVGTVYGTPPNDAFNSNRTSGFGPGLVGSAAQSQWILTSVESMFMYAELSPTDGLTGMPVLLMKMQYGSHSNGLALLIRFLLRMPT